jgi:hypothetical protein
LNDDCIRQQLHAKVSVVGRDGDVDDSVFVTLHSARTLHGGTSMDFSNRLTRGAWAPIVIALIAACGSNDEGSSPGSTGTGGAGGSSTGTAGAAGASGMAGATGDGAAGAGAGGASGAGGAGGATGTDGGTGKGGGAGKDGGAGKGGAAGAEGGAGKAGAAGTAVDGGTSGDVSGDVSMPPRPDVISDVVLPPVDGPEDLIRELVGRLRAEAFDAKCRELEAMSQPNRKTKTANYTAATEWVKGWLATEAPRLAVTFDDWSGSRNIEIKIAGTDPTAGMYVIGGHLDSVAATAGMDDDGSGSLGSAMLASAMSHYLYKSEIRLMLFDGEESGFVGSTHYAQALMAAGCQPETCMKLFINLDMIGYDPMDTGNVRVRFDLAGPKMVAQQVKGYVAGLTVTEGTGNCHSSDDCGFSRNGYPNAGELIEPSNNPQWHKVGDTCDNMNSKTVNKTLQLAGAMLATMGGIHSRAP